MSVENKRQIISSIAQKHAKALFASDLMLGNRKYIDSHAIFDALYGLTMDMLDRFEAQQYENKFESSHFDENSDEFDELHDFVNNWTDKFRAPLFIVREEFIDYGGRKLDPRVNEHDLGLTDALVAILKDYYERMTQK